MPTFALGVRLAVGIAAGAGAPAGQAARTRHELTVVPRASAASATALGFAGERLEIRTPRAANTITENDRTRTTR